MYNLSPVLAIILNWNEIDQTRRCVSSLLSQRCISCDVLVVDNHSKEDPTILLQEEFDKIHVIRNLKNLGVAAGRNVGIRYALDRGYEFVFLFDNDAFADPKMLMNLKEAAYRYPDTGIFGPKILRDDTPNIIWRAGCTSWKWTYLHAGSKILNRFLKIFNVSYPTRLDTTRGEDQMDRGQYDEEEITAFQIGCAQLIRADVFRNIGLLDEEYSPYGSEDIDFCARATKAKWLIRYIPKARCWHRAGGSFQDEYQRGYFNSKHIMLLARKNLNLAYFWFLFIPDFLLLTAPLTLLKNTIKKKYRYRKAFIDAIVWNINDISKRGILIENKKMHLFSSLPASNPDSSEGV